MSYDTTGGTLETKLFDISWEEDLALRTEPKMWTALAREQVPVLEFVDWQITEVHPGDVTTVLPLNPPSTNQHFTHQAALIVLTADYTGGASLASLLWGWPIVGVHPIGSSKSMSLWLLKAEMKYLKPSTKDLTIRAVVDEGRRQKIQKRFLAGKPVIETIEIRCMNGGELVAEGSCTYFARQSIALRATGIDPDKVNSLFALKLTSSAEMIAGVRARESGGLFEDPFAEAMAGQHGMAVATRFCQRSPQLGPMVAARTRHADEVVESFAAAGGRHVVNLGVGWDMRPFRLDLPEGMHFYEMDFPTTLDERAARIEQQGIQEKPGVTRSQHPIDLRSMSASETLAGQVPEDEPLLVIWEGMSMYFEEDDAKAVLFDLRSLLRHEDSLLWMDLVDREPVVNPAAFAEPIQNFMRGMQILGEPFVFGSDTPMEFIEACGLRSLDVVTSDVFFPDAIDPVYSIYQFCLVAGGVSRADHRPRTLNGLNPHKPAAGTPKPHFNYESQPGAISKSEEQNA